LCSLAMDAAPHTDKIIENRQFSEINHQK